MSTWYYLEDGVARGPAPHEELLALFREQRLPAHTLVCRVGQQEWTPAREMGLLPAAPPPPLQANPSFGQPRPAGPSVAVLTRSEASTTELAWRRYLARLVDFFLFAAVVGLGISVMVPSVAEWVADGRGTLLGLGIALAFVPLEAWMLASSGATPGKRLFALRVRTADGSPLTFERALQRSARVYFLGQAFGLPIVTQIAKLFALDRFRRTGTTLWDEQCGTLVEHGELTPARKFSAAVILCIYLTMMYMVAAAQLG
jgi:uncharacterized RDD family membrane protein YckC